MLLNKQKAFYLRGGVALVCLLFYAAWASVLPVCQAPDEVTRLAVPFWIAQHGCLPNGFEESIRNTLWGISYAFTPYGNSLLSALFIKVASIIGCDAAGQVIAARLSSCICGAATVYVVMLLGDEFSFDRLVSLFMGLALGLLPQFAFLSSYLNNDVFSALCTALVILAWVRGLKSNWCKSDCVLLGVSLGLLSLSYYFAYALIPLSVLVFFATLLQQDEPIRKVLLRALLVLCVALAIGGWFFVWNALNYSGDFLGMKVYAECAEQYAATGFKPSDHSTPKLNGDCFMSPLWNKEWLLLTFESSIGILGYMSYFLPGIAYKSAALLIAVGIALNLVPGLGASSLRIAFSGERFKRWTLFIALIAAGVAAVLFSAYRSWATDYQPQGRYIISAWIPLLLFLAMGLNRLLCALQKPLLKGSVVGVLICASVCLLILAVVVFYPAGFMGVTSSSGLESGPAIMASLL